MGSANQPLNPRQDEPIALAIHRRERTIEPSVIEKFRELPVANVSDCLPADVRGLARLRPFHRSGRLAGPALTVKVPFDDTLLVHAALDRGQPGDVLVVDAGGGRTIATMGEIMLSYARAKGFAGVVIFGAVRDSAYIASQDFPVFAMGVTHRGPTKNGPGEINGAIVIDEMAVEPGDLILGDEDGLVCVAHAKLEQVYAAASNKLHAEEQMLVAIREGRLDRSWLNDALQGLGGRP